MNSGPSPSRSGTLAGALTQFWLKNELPTKNCARCSAVELRHRQAERIAGGVEHGGGTAERGSAEAWARSLQALRQRGAKARPRLASSARREMRARLTAAPRWPGRDRAPSAPRLREVSRAGLERADGLAGSPRARARCRHPGSPDRTAQGSRARRRRSRICGLQRLAEAGSAGAHQRTDSRGPHGRCHRAVR